MANSIFNVKLMTENYIKIYQQVIKENKN